MIRLLKSIMTIILLVSFLLLTACTTPGIGNNAPYITSLTANPDSIGVNQMTTLICTAYDSDGDTLTYTWNKDTNEEEEEEEEDEPPEDERILPSISKVAGTISGSGKTVTWNAPSTTGSYTVTCTVSDGKGGEDNASISIDVSKLSEEDKIKNVTQELFQALSDQDWNKARSYCIYGGWAYEEINDAEDQFFLDSQNISGTLDKNYSISIGEIIIEGEHAYIYGYFTETTIVNGEIVEEVNYEAWNYLLKIVNDWKMT